jgi:predicted Rossmann fold nucleotide-binding protein DprA/Smf involved in DNA uptake
MRAGELRDLPEVLRDGMYLQQRVLEVLKDGPKTIPEIAEALGAPPRETMLWVMALRRYGRISELPKATTDDYYRYQAKGAAP